MIRHFGSLVVAVLVAGCVAGPTSSPGTMASPSAPPSGPTVSPTRSTVAVLPSPTAPDCLPFDLSRQSQPGVTLASTDPTDREGAYGLNGSSTIGGEVFDGGSWHQPGPGAALVIGRSAELTLAASLDDVGDMATCLGTVRLNYAPFSPTATAPAEETLGELSAKVTEDPASSFRFQGPSAAGEWIVRATITFPTDPGPSSIESFFRLRVDSPAPAVGGKASRPFACGAPGERPPRAYLSVADGAPIAAEPGTFNWHLTAGDAPEPPGEEVTAGVGEVLVVSIEDNVCAGWWGIDLAPPGRDAFSSREPFLDVVPAHGQGEAVQPIRVNRFRLAAMPPGEWWLMAYLEFAESNSNEEVGLTTNFWHVVVR